MNSMRLPLIDPHTHINPHAPASKTLADIMGYHYYTELAHSAGHAQGHSSRSRNSSPKKKVGRLVEALDRWTTRSSTVGSSKWAASSSASTATASRPTIGRRCTIRRQRRWRSPTGTINAAEVQSGRRLSDERVRRSADGVRHERYIPCLRTDDLVFHLAKPEVRKRLAAAANIECQQRGDAEGSHRQTVRAFRQPQREGLRDFAAAGFRAAASQRRRGRSGRGRHFSHGGPRSGEQHGESGQVRVLDARPNSAPSTACRSI